MSPYSQDLEKKTLDINELHLFNQMPEENLREKKTICTSIVECDWFDLKRKRQKFFNILIKRQGKAFVERSFLFQFQNDHNCDDNSDN